MAQQCQTVRPLVGRVGIRKMLADVSKRERAQKRIHHRVCEHIRVRMSVQAKLERNVYAADDTAPPLNQPMDVIAVSDPHIHFFSLLYRNASATAMSSGVVTLMFS